MTDEEVAAVVSKRNACRGWCGRLCGTWATIQDNNGNGSNSMEQLSPRLEMSDDAEDLRGGPLAEKKFLIQFQATHSDNYADTLTAAQLQPMTRSVYGVLRFAYPVSQTSYHDPLQGTHTLLALAIPETYTNWVNHDYWPHIAMHLLGGFWRITLVAEVDWRCENAEVGLLSLDRRVGRSGSE
jgi:hypothetical protein